MCSAYPMPRPQYELFEKHQRPRLPVVEPLFAAEQVEAMTPSVNWSERVAGRMAAFKGWVDEIRTAAPGGEGGGSF